MTTSRKAWKLHEEPEKQPGLLDFSFKNFVVICLAVPLMVITACHHATSDSGADFGKVVTASDIDAHNAPTALADTFSPSQKAIYVVAEAKQVAPGTRLSATWSRDGTPVQVSDEVVATQGYHDTNIEFHLNPGAGGFAPGSYKAQIIVDGKPGPEASFTVK
ncbi:MAG TPA: hypothetical protein VG733_14440 [Chthoniobacteraceae bacterium]|nr:hypothetical protein [Chthoniobacteraceae bacterium]